MPIASTDIQLRRAGASGLGGAMSATVVDPAALFDIVAEADSVSGHTDYRCFYVRNGHATLTLENLVAWISANTPYAGTTLTIGLGTSAVNGTEQTIASETTAPTGVTFSAAATAGAGLAIGNLAPGASKAVWVRRVTTAGTAPASQVADTAQLKFDGGYTE